jgi:hypothetical protein
MRVLITILQKVIVNHFYRVNAGFFLFMFFVLFGLPYSVLSFHLSIINIIIQNPSALTGAMLVWLLYNFKCMDYVIKQLKEPRQQFLFCLNNISPRSCFGYMIYVQALVYLPVLVYSIIVAAIAFKTQYYTAMAGVLVFNAALILLTAAAYLRVLQLRPFLNTGVILPQMRFRLGKPVFSIPLYFLLHSRRQMLLVTKFFSLLLLFGFMRLYEPDHYDIRPLLLCFMLATAANSAIVFELKIFEDGLMPFVRNFPFSLVKRFALVLLMYAVLLLPELAFVWKAYPLHFHVADYLQILLLGTGLLSLFHGSLLTDDMNTDVYFKIVFAILAILFFTILYNPGILLECLLLAVSFGLFTSYYYDFERRYD